MKIINKELLKNRVITVNEYDNYDGATYNVIISQVMDSKTVDCILCCGKDKGKADKLFNIITTLDILNMRIRDK